MCNYETPISRKLLLREQAVMDAITGERSPFDMSMRELAERISNDPIVYSNEAMTELSFPDLANIRLHPSRQLPFICPPDKEEILLKAFNGDRGAQ